VARAWVRSAQRSTWHRSCLAIPRAKARRRMRPDQCRPRRLARHRRFLHVYPDDGRRRVEARDIAILNANYVGAGLDAHFPVRRPIGTHASFLRRNCWLSRAGGRRHEQPGTGGPSLEPFGTRPGPVLRFCLGLMRVSPNCASTEKIGNSKIGKPTRTYGIGFRNVGRT